MNLKRYVKFVNDASLVSNIFALLYVTNSLIFVFHAGHKGLL